MFQGVKSQPEEETMTKKHFIALANAIREHNRMVGTSTFGGSFYQEQLEVLADFCQSQNPRFTV
jgi:hypothetical protein